MVAQVIWIGVTTLLLLVSFWRPIYLQQQLLQHVPTVLGIAGLAVASHRGWLSTRAIAATCAFLWLHILGARYIYTYVPYDEWSNELFGTAVSELFGWRRNHYDRLVHFLFGILACIPLYDVARRYGNMGRGWSGVFAAACVMSIGSIYEVFEWSLTLFVSPEVARRYNGQQGDLWDPQKDVALAMLGIVVIGLFAAVRARRAQGT